MQIFQIIDTRALVLLVLMLGGLHAGALAQTQNPCAAGPTVEGLDVSHYQGSIDWQAVKASGRVFAIASVGHGLWADPTFRQNWDGMKAAGLVRGAYQFFSYLSDPVEQANVAIAAVGALEPGDLPLALDVEREPDVTTPPAADVADRVKRWVERVEQVTGKRPIIYTGPGFWDSDVQSGDFATYPLWLASWSTAQCPPVVSQYWPTWTFWQYLAGGGDGLPPGSVDGVQGAVDVDRFNGSLEDLRRFAAGSGGGGGGGGRSPIGYLDTLQWQTDGIRATGWTADEDTPQAPNDVHFYVTGPAPEQIQAGYNKGAAAVPRPDVAAARPDLGPAHGFDVVLPFVQGGTYGVCAFGINAAGTGGENTLLECREFVVPNPFGALDEVTWTGSGVRVRGWTADGDAPWLFNDVHVYIDQQGFNLGPAQLSRPDVEAVWPRYTGNRGFDTVLHYTTKGTHQACAYGINVANTAGGNVQLGCKPVTIP